MENMALATGAGTCVPAFSLNVSFHREALDLGAGPDLFQAVFAAVHRVNRRTSPEDYVGLTLPGAHVGRGIRGLMELGAEVCAFGSEEALQRVLNDKELLKLGARQMYSARIREVDFDGAEGCFLVRDRTHEKTRTPAALARQERRNAKRAAHIAATEGTKSSFSGPMPLPGEGRGFVPLAVNRKIFFGFGSAPLTAEPLLVSTYGLSTKAAPAVFPIAPHAAG